MQTRTLWMKVRRLYWGSPRLIQAMLPPLVAFVVAALLAPIYSSEETDLALTLWQAVVTWPIGAAFLFVPAWLLANVTDRRLFRAGQVILIMVAVGAEVARAHDEHSTEGLNWLYIPWYGVPAMLGLVLLQLILRRRQGR